MKELTILNKRIGLQPRHQAKLKGITIEDKLSYKFYDGTYQTVPFNKDPRVEGELERLINEMIWKD